MSLTISEKLRLGYFDEETTHQLTELLTSYEDDSEALQFLDYVWERVIDPDSNYKAFASEVCTDYKKNYKEEVPDRYPECKDL